MDERGGCSTVETDKQARAQMEDNIEAHEQEISKSVKKSLLWKVEENDK